MTFATEAAKSGSERFFLVRLTPRKYLGVGTSIGGSQYTFAVLSTVNVSIVTVNNVTEVVWTHIGDVLTVTSATNLANVVNIVTIDHDIFVTGTTTRYTASISGVPDAEWLPLLVNYPSNSQSMSNIAEGIFSLSNTDLQLISDDRFLQKYMGINDSFSNSDVRIWVCINELSINRVIFDGKVSSISVAKGQVSFSILDTFLGLSTATGQFGTTAQSTISLGGTFGDFPATEDRGNAAPITIGKSSPMILQEGYNHSPFVSFSSPVYHQTGGIKAIIDTPGNFDVNTVVTYFAGRFVGTTLKKTTFGTMTYRVTETKVTGSLFNFSYVHGRIEHIQCTNFSGEVGDWVPELGAVICHNKDYVGPFGVTYNFTVVNQTFRYETSSPNPAGLIVNSIIALASDVTYSACLYRELSGSNQLIKGDAAPTSYAPDNIYYMQGNFATPSIVPVGTIGGQTVSALYWSVDLSAIGAASRMNFGPSEAKLMRSRFSPATTMKHGQAMKFIMESAGYAVNSASFTQADIDLNEDVSLTFPLEGAKKFDTYLNYAEYIAKSAFSLLRVNTDREIVYEVIKNPSGESLDAERDNSDILVSSFRSSVQYQDITSEVDFYNPQLLGADESVGNAGAKAIVTNDKAKYLHKNDLKKEYKHCLVSIQNRKSAIAGYLSEPTVQYTLETSSNDLSTLIGDVISLSNNSVLGESDSVTALVISTDSSSQNTKIKLNEIRGVP